MSQMKIPFGVRSTRQQLSPNLKTKMNMITEVSNYAGCTSLII